MKLTSDQKRIFADWLRRKMEHHSCQLCQANHWKVGEFMPSTSSTAVDEFDAAKSHGLVHLICQNCANVLMFDVRYIQDWSQHDTTHSAVM